MADEKPKPLWPESPTDLAMDAPRTDLFGLTVPFHRKNAWTDESEMEKLAQQSSVSRVAAACKEAGLGPDATGAALTRASREAQGYYSLGQSHFINFLFTTAGVELTIWLSGRKHAEKNKTNWSPDKPRELLMVKENAARITKRLLEDFVCWFWRIGAYSPPKSEPEAGQSLDAAKS